jgi:hypothetical protein
VREVATSFHQRLDVAFVVKQVSYQPAKSKQAFLRFSQIGLVFDRGPVTLMK